MPTVSVTTEATEKYNLFAILGLVFSLTIWPLGFVFSIMARNQIKADPTLKGANLALAGLIISWFVTVLGVLGIISWVILLNDLSNLGY
jgi:hypothetical protein